MWMKNEKDKVKPIYQELQGFLSQTPLPKNNYDRLTEDSWDLVNQSIDKLNQETSKDYNKFRIEPEIVDGIAKVYVTVFRQKLGGLIDYLHAEYFEEDQRPFSGQPSTIVSQNQTQNMSVQLYVQFGMELQKAMERAETEEEKSFLKDISGKIETVKTFIEFILLVTNLAVKHGITMDRLKTIFGG